MTRHTTTSTLELTAQCHACPWTTSAPNGLGNAARHHDATTHPVSITITRAITYGNPHAPTAGQAALDAPDLAA